MSNTILRVKNLVKYFHVGQKMFLKSNFTVKAVDNISFSLKKGNIFALVGESGCGKTTLARLIMRLIEPTSGEVIFEGKDMFKLSSSELNRIRKDMQMIFQDPYSSLNPRWKVRWILSEPLDTHKIGTRKERQEKVFKMLETVGLNRESSEKYPHEFSGGQRQRIGIARALITNPKLVICDEPISSLDVSIQAQIINLLKELQLKFDLTYLFITHDLRMVRFLSDYVGVIYLGKIVEIGPTHELFQNPYHPYTQALFSAIPLPDPDIKKAEFQLEGEIPSQINTPMGCRFYSRCPYARQICSEQEPEMHTDGEHMCACHFYDKLKKFNLKNVIA